MSCFDQVVSLKELCTTQETFTGVYLNDVGITKAFIEDIITSDYVDVQEFVDSKIAQAIRIIQIDAAARFAGRINATSLINSHRLGWTVDNIPTQAGGDWKGITICLSTQAAFTNLELSQLSLQVLHNGNVPVHVYDLNQNKLLDTINVTAVSGEIITVFPHVEYPSDGRALNLFIGYDATGISSVKTTIVQNQCTSCGYYSCVNEYIRAKGVTNSTGHFVDQNMTTIDHTGGLSLVYSLRCDMQSWLCTFARALAIPIANKVAVEMYQHGIRDALNRRSSNTTNLNVDHMKETLNQYEFEYQKHMTTILGNVQMPTDSPCFTCNAPVRTAVVLP